MSRSEKNELTEEAHRIIKTIKQMEASLEDFNPSNTYQLDHHDLKVTVPLTRCLQKLKEKHVTIAKIHQDRFEQVKSNTD
jgi:protein regulator of cytokinesis 1